MYKLLIVDDEERIRTLIKKYALLEGHSVSEACNGLEAVRFCQSESFDIIIMDIMMPELDGFSAVKALREFSQAPVIMLSARGEEYDKLHGFELGVDDYVVKPFDLAVLYSRLLALLRRTKTVTDTTLFCDDLMLDKEKTAVYDGQKEIVVSQPEYRILLILMENKGKTITRNQLLEQVWDRSGNYVNDNTLTVTMKRLREKLNHPACLKTIRSFGYRMEDTQ